MGGVAWLQCLVCWVWGWRLVAVKLGLGMVHGGYGAALLLLL